MRVLAIDIGGTKTAVGLCNLADGRVASISDLAHFVSREFTSLEDVISAWQSSHASTTFDGIGAGVAGPGGNGYAHVTNLGWSISAQNIEAKFSCVVKLCNDMEAHGWGLVGIEAANLLPLNEGSPQAGPKALIAAGTGLGEAIIGWNGSSHCPMAGEGGHSSFSPTSNLEIELLVFMQKHLSGHVSWERILGGLDGFRNLGSFMAHHKRVKLPKYLEDSKLDWGASIIAAAERGDDFAIEILNFYSLLYGKEAGNLALKCVPRSGVYIGGGIAPRILPYLKENFMKGFTDKGRFRELLSSFPVYIIQDKLNGLKGAALQFL